MNWIQFVWTAVSAVAGGFIGGWAVAYRLGQWRESIEQRLRNAEKRLEKGDVPLDEVPVLRARLDIVIEELRDIKRQLREDLGRMVSRVECERRHERDGEP